MGGGACAQMGPFKPLGDVVLRDVEAAVLDEANGPRVYSSGSAAEHAEAWSKLRGRTASTQL